MAVRGLQTDGSTQSIAQRPFHNAALERKHQPGNTHQGDNREAYIRSNAHLASFQAVQKHAVQTARNRGNRQTNHNRKSEAEPAAEAKLDTEQAAQQTADNTDRQP